VKDLLPSYDSGQMDPQWPYTWMSKVYQSEEGELSVVLK